jgi:hypothetical protein
VANLKKVKSQIMRVSNKKISIGFTIFIMLVATSSPYYNDTMASLRSQLEMLYIGEFNNSEILSIVEREYPGKRVNYKLFTVNSSNNYYPILFDKLTDPSTDSLFKVGAYINKAQKSNNLKLTTNNMTYILKMRNTKDADDRLFVALGSIIFFSIVLIIQIFLPEAFFELKHNKTK